MKTKNKNSLVIEQPIPIRKQVYEHLRNEILNNNMQAADRLVEAQIAGNLGISRTPVREALHLLEKDGFVESIPRVGYRVKTLALHELEEIFDIRMVNELLACKWAVKNIDAKGLRAMEQNLSQTRSAIEKGRPETFLDYDQEFHEILVTASGSQYLAELCQHLRRLLLRYRIKSIRDAEMVNKALKGHVRMYEALREKDGKRLELELKHHLEYAKNDIRDCAIKGMGSN